MPRRLGERNREISLPHVLGGRYKRPIRMLGLHQLQFDVLLESQSSRHSFISVALARFPRDKPNCLSKCLFLVMQLNSQSIPQRTWE